MSFDLVILVGPKDKDIINKSIEYNKTNIIGHRNIYLISAFPDLEVNNCITIDEKVFDVYRQYVDENLNPRISHRKGWYFQQLIKLYAKHVLGDLLDWYLVVDADTMFLKPVTFVKEGKLCYNYGSENNPHYFIHSRLLHESLTRQNHKMSGICHHMIFDKNKLDQLFELVESKHQKEFYKVFVDFVNPGHHSGASEYEIYFNYILKYHKKDIVIRGLKWENSKHIIDNGKNDYISVHHYLRNN